MSDIYTYLKEDGGIDDAISHGIAIWKDIDYLKQDCIEYDDAVGDGVIIYRIDLVPICRFRYEAKEVPL